MPAQFRIDQVTPGAGVAGRSRHDLVPGEIITLNATSPTPGAGVSYSWEILDKRGSTAVLSGTTGQTVIIGISGLIIRPSAFLIELTVNDNGIITKSRRIASVRTLNAQLRVPVYVETAPMSNKLSLHDADLATDNALYGNRSGLGVAEQNWAGWSEWAWELVMAVESSIGASGPPSGPASGDLSLSYPGPRVSKLYGVAIDASAASPATGSVLKYDGTNYKPSVVTGKQYNKVVVGNSGQGDISSDCDFLDNGNCLGIEAALASLGGQGGDIFVRPGNYSLNTHSGAATPLVVPNNVRLIFAHKASCTLTACMTPDIDESMAIFSIQGAGQVENLTIYIDAPGFTNAGTENTFIDVGTAGVLRNIDIFMGAILSGAWADFGNISSVVQFTAASHVEDVVIYSPPSFIVSGGNVLTSFHGSGSPGTNPFYVVRCRVNSSSMTRGGDIGFSTNFGPGYFESCAPTNALETGFLLYESSEGVQITDPQIVWTGSDVFGHLAVVFGDGDPSDHVIDCHVRGGYIDGQSSIGSPAFGFTTDSGEVNRNKIHGVTVRNFGVAAGFIASSGGHLNANDIQFCTFKNVPSVYDTDGNDTNTVIDNNVNDTGGGA
jgi:hypothetical protein